MALAKAVAARADSYTLKDAMSVLLTKLDEALDDVEKGRVLTEEDLWAEIDKI